MLVTILRTCLCRCGNYDVLAVVKSVKPALPWERGIVRLQLATTSVYANVVSESPQQSAYLP